MKYILIYIFIFSLWNNNINANSIPVHNLHKKFLDINSEIWKNFNGNEENDNYIDSAVIQYRDIAGDIQKLMPNHLTDGLRPIQHQRLWMTTYSQLRRIQSLYDLFRRMLYLEKNSIPEPAQQYLNFTEQIDFLQMTISNIQDGILENKLFEKILTYATFDHCELGQSSHQILYNLYNAITLTQLKGFMMTEFAYYILTSQKKDFKLVEHTNNVKEYENTFTRTKNITEHTMEKANRYFWRCDPKYHEKEKTYTELTQLLQGYLENEVDMNQRSNCLQNCQYYDYTHNMGCYRGICKKQKICKGKIVECKYIASDMTVCESASGSGRRYDYIEYDNDRVFGRNTGCTRGTTRVESWWRWLFWHCSYCICLCDDETNESDRYFSLKDVVSDVKNNMVVTGIRFQKMKRVIHLQIQEGKLGPYGQINMSSVHWVDINPFVINRHVKDGVDYHKMTYEKRDIDLDDLSAEEGHLVTGVRFRVIGAHLNLEIQTTPFNFTTGFLKQPTLKSVWTSSDSTLTRKKLTLKNPDVPTRTQTPSVIDSKHDMFMEFTNSDLERDVGQNTVPYIDIQDVSLDIPVPLDGIGIYHKGQPNFGGFIGPKIFTYNYAKHM